jgi:hypothetical protein
VERTVDEEWSITGLGRRRKERVWSNSIFEGSMIMIRRLEIQPRGLLDMKGSMVATCKVPVGLGGGEIERLDLLVEIDDQGGERTEKVTD